MTTTTPNACAHVDRGASQVLLFEDPQEQYMLVERWTPVAHRVVENKGLRVALMECGGKAGVGNEAAVEVSGRIGSTANYWGLIRPCPMQNWTLGYYRSKTNKISGVAQECMGEFWRSERPRYIRRRTDSTLEVGLDIGSPVGALQVAGSIR